MDTVNPVAQRWYTEAAEDPEGFWARAADELPWFRKWDRVYERDYPTFRWFIGAKTNLAYNCVDRHVAQGRGGHAAIAYVNERGERRVLTYAQLRYEVRRVSAALRGMGIGKGDRITIYMPVVPEAIILMLATVRIGAIHSVVFAGFGAGALGTASGPAARASCSRPTSRIVRGATSTSKRSWTRPWRMGRPWTTSWSWRVAGTVRP
jgi:acetyl-CoA synthetase